MEIDFKNTYTFEGKLMSQKFEYHTVTDINLVIDHLIKK